MLEIVPSESYIIAGGPEPVAMAIALENFDSAKVAKMSKQMLKIGRKFYKKRRLGIC